MVEGGHLVRDLRADISAEAGALNTYEALIKLTDDEGTRKALNELATREVSHTHMFMEALRSINGLTEPLFGDLKPNPSVNLYFNLSSGAGAERRGPWNSEPAFQYIADPLQHELSEHGGGNTPSTNEMLTAQQLSNQPGSTSAQMGGPQTRQSGQTQSKSGSQR